MNKSIDFSNFRKEYANYRINNINSKNDSPDGQQGGKPGGPQGGNPGGPQGGQPEGSQGGQRGATMDDGIKPGEGPGWDLPRDNKSNDIKDNYKIGNNGCPVSIIGDGKIGYDTANLAINELFKSGKDKTQIIEELKKMLEKGNNGMRSLVSEAYTGNTYEISTFDEGYRYAVMCALETLTQRNNSREEGRSIGSVGVSGIYSNADGRTKKQSEDLRDAIEAYYREVEGTDDPSANIPPVVKRGIANADLDEIGGYTSDWIGAIKNLLISQKSKINELPPDKRQIALFGVAPTEVDRIDGKGGRLVFYIDTSGSVLGSDSLSDFLVFAYMICSECNFETLDINTFSDKVCTNRISMPVGLDDDDVRKTISNLRYESGGTSYWPCYNDIYENYIKKQVEFDAIVFITDTDLGHAQGAKAYRKSGNPGARYINDWGERSVYLIVVDYDPDKYEPGMFKASIDNIPENSTPIILRKTFMRNVRTVIPNNFSKMYESAEDDDFSCLDGIDMNIEGTVAGEFNDPYSTNDDDYVTRMNQLAARVIDAQKNIDSGGKTVYVTYGDNYGTHAEQSKEIDYKNKEELDIIRKKRT